VAAALAVVLTTTAFAQPINPSSLSEDQLNALKYATATAVISECIVPAIDRSNPRDLKLFTDAMFVLAMISGPLVKEPEVQWATSRLL
jgi:hypothetical protein